MQNSEITNLDAARQFGLGVLLGVSTSIDHDGETDPFTRRAVAAGLAARNAGDPDAGLRFAVHHYRRHGSRKPRGTLTRRAEHLARFLPEDDSDCSAIADLDSQRRKVLERCRTYGDRTHPVYLDWKRRVLAEAQRIQEECHAHIGTRRGQIQGNSEADK